MVARVTGTVDREKGDTMDVLKVSGDGDLWTAKTRFNREMASGTLMCGHSARHSVETVLIVFTVGAIIDFVGAINIFCDQNYC